MWMGACTSSIGTWMQIAAQSWLVLKLSNSPFLLGLDAFLGGIPFDSTISEAQRQAKTILELVPDCGASRAIRYISRILKERMEVV